MAHLERSSSPISSSIVFLLAGASFATWASRLPEVKAHFSISDIQLSILLLAMSVGSLATLPLSGATLRRTGTRRGVLIGVAINGAGWITASAAISTETYSALMLAMVLCGLGTGLWNPAMNLAGAAWEYNHKRIILPRLHALFALGAAGGALIGAAAYSAQISPSTHILISSIATIALGTLCVRHLDEVSRPAVALRAQGAGEQAITPWRESRTLRIGVIVMAVAFAEGAGSEWLPIITQATFSCVSPGLILAAYLGGITISRFLGHHVIVRYGRTATYIAGAVVASLAILLLALQSATTNWVALGLYAALWGAGIALGFPMAMSAAADSPNEAAARIGAASTMGYCAFLSGPPVMGVVIDIWGHRAALVVAAIPIIGTIIIAKALRSATPNEPSNRTPMKESSSK